MTGSVKLNSAGGGSVTLVTPSTASNLTLTLPSASGTIATAAGTETLTNKTLTATGGNTVEATSGPTSSQLAGNRNKIINGAMMIDQRNAGASVTPANGQYLTDRWVYAAYQANKVTAQQSTNAPAGFTNSLLITSSSAYTVGASEYFIVQQRIEGFNIADLGWGGASAKTVTLSFWVRSSLTGTFGGSLGNDGLARSYPFSFTISAANTWEQKTVTVTGDTSGTWLTNNGLGMYVIFNLGSGSTFSTTAGAWASGQYTAPTGATSVVGTNGATFYITGVQLEKGATATPFENRLYGTELALCQRYYWQINSETSYAGLGSGVMNTATVARIFMPYPTPMRATPTISITSPSSFTVSQGYDLTPTNLTAYANSKTSMFDMATNTGVLGRGAVLLFANVSTGSIQATAEL